MTDWQRLEKVIKYVGLSTNAFAKSIGYSRSELLYRIERGENCISKKLASDITIKYFKISESFLLTGEGEMLKESDNIEIENQKPTQNTTLVPYYDIDISASITESFRMGRFAYLLESNMDRLNMIAKYLNFTMLILNLNYHQI